jgi:hypothetical protein
MFLHWKLVTICLLSIQQCAVVLCQ